MSTHSMTCSCGASLVRARFDRRRFLHLAAGGGLMAAVPSRLFAAEGNYEAMLLYCIDPRVPALTLDYMKGRDLLGKYSQFVIAGGAIGVVAPEFKDWQKAFWDNLAVSMEHHHIPKVIALDHRDCAAAKIAYGEANVANREIETQTHRAALAEFRRQVAERQPKLAVETGLMALDGTVAMFG